MATRSLPSSRRTRRNSPAFILAVIDRTSENDRAGVRHESIGIGDNPLAFGIAPGRGIHGRNGDVDSMRIEADPAREGAEVEPVATAGIENNVAGAWSREIGDGIEQRDRHAEIVQSPAPRDGSRGVTRVLRPPFLRLEQVDVSAPRNVERMSSRTNQPPPLAQQRHVAIADGAEEHSSSVANDDGDTIKT